MHTYICLFFSILLYTHTQYIKVFMFECIYIHTYIYMFANSELQAQLREVQSLSGLAFLLSLFANIYSFSQLYFSQTFHMLTVNQLKIHFIQQCIAILWGESSQNDSYFLFKNLTINKLNAKEIVPQIPACYKKYDIEFHSNAMNI